MAFTRAIVFCAATVPPTRPRKRARLFVRMTARLVGEAGRHKSLFGASAWLALAEQAKAAHASLYGEAALQPQNGAEIARKPAKSGKKRGGYAGRPVAGRAGPGHQQLPSPDCIARQKRLSGGGRFSRIVRLGEGVGQSGLLSDVALDRTIAALKICADRIAKYKVKHVRAIATQAARLAGNADVLVARARSEAGLELRVISAEEEADLAAIGCAPLIGRKYKGALVFDIGGGSTEIIWLAKSPDGPKTRLAASIPLGVVSLAESYGPGSASRDGFERMRADLRERFAVYAKQMDGFDIRKNHLLGTSGTVTTLAAIALKLPRYNRSGWMEAGMKPARC